MAELDASREINENSTCESYREIYRNVGGFSVTTQEVDTDAYHSPAAEASRKRKLTDAGSQSCQIAPFLKMKEMKTPEEILNDKFNGLSAYYHHPIQQAAVIAAMEEYAIQSVECDKRALELERDVVSYKQAFEEVSRSRNEWISEVQSIRAQKVQVSMQLEEAIKLLQTWIHDHAPLNESINFVQAYWNEHNIFPYEP